jgi:hypothetical protein
MTGEKRLRNKAAKTINMEVTRVTEATEIAEEVGRLMACSGALRVARQRSHTSGTHERVLDPPARS